MLEARALVKQFGGLRAVDQVTFSVGPSEVLGYLGPNGSGKTTTVNMLVGLIQPTAGQVHFGGQDIWQDIVTYRRRVGYVPEEPNLYPYLTGREYLQLVGRFARPSGSGARQEDRGAAWSVLARARQPLAPLLVLEGHAAEGAHQRGARAQSRPAGVRRTDVRPRRGFRGRVPAPDQGAGSRGQDGALQLS